MSRKEQSLDAVELRRLLEYSAETGIFRWRIARSNRIKVGDIAGSHDHGYLTIRINGLAHFCHRLAWLYIYGHWPCGHLDHKNLKRSDNRIENLRLATVAQNIINTPARSLSGLKGVWELRDGRYKAMCCGKHLGSFRTAEAASEAYLKFTKIKYGEFARPY